MPQLDKTIIFTQIFWLFLIFTFSYIILVHYFFPLFLKSLKSRKLIIESNLLESKKAHEKFLLNQNTLSKILNEGLGVVKVLYSSEFLFKEGKGQTFSLNSLDAKLVKMFLNMMLYNDKRVLKNIPLTSRTYNSSCK